ncbi:MAG TPA: bifunctional RNase H/acid phosphatase [Jatrophihabitans sp.]|nr:bifunctional RNase H/acid phosphatase [Jatrophihabitans sp.]
MSEPASSRPVVAGAGRRVVVEADGGSRGNPGPAGYGALVLDADTDAVLDERQAAIGVASNNVAEYRGLIAGLTAAAELGAVQVEVRMDSQLVIEQLAGRYRVKSEVLQPLYARASELAGRFERVDYRWVPRAENVRADRLANQAMDVAAADSAEAAMGAAEPANNLSAWVPSGAPPTRFVLVRHGVTELSVARRFAGRSDLPLTERGVRQAELAADRLAGLADSVAAVLSSPLLRTRQTADRIADRLELPVSIEDGLIETDYGVWDGHSFDEVRQRWPDDLTRWLADPTALPTGGESFATVGRRVGAARDRIVERHPGQTVLLVSHVSPIKLLVQSALGAPVSAVHRMYLDPASITVIDYLDGNPAGASLRGYNDTAHLGAD